VRSTKLPGRSKKRLVTKALFYIFLYQSIVAATAGSPSTTARWPT
jgi:hypothetical protein